MYLRNFIASQVPASATWGFKPRVPKPELANVRKTQANGICHIFQAYTGQSLSLHQLPLNPIVSGLGVSISALPSLSPQCPENWFQALTVSSDGLS